MGRKIVIAKEDKYSGHNRRRHPIKKGEKYVVLNEKTDGVNVSYLLELAGNQSYGWTNANDYDLV